MAVIAHCPAGLKRAAIHRVDGLDAAARSLIVVVPDEGHVGVGRGAAEAVLDAAGGDRDLTPAGAQGGQLLATESKTNAVGARDRTAFGDGDAPELAFALANQDRGVRFHGEGAHLVDSNAIALAL